MFSIAETLGDFTDFPHGQEIAGRISLGAHQVR